MAEVGLVDFAKCALAIAKRVVPSYRSKYSKHTFTQPQLLAILCLMRYEGWTFRETEVRLQEHVELRQALGLKQTSDYTTFYRFMRRLNAELVHLALQEAALQTIEQQPTKRAVFTVDATGPFTMHGNILVDVRKPYFGAAAELQPDDFQTPADRNAAGVMENVSGALWYMATLDESAFPYINLAGSAQFRLRFTLDDNDDNDQDYMKFFSGDAETADQPVLTIDYYLLATGSPLVAGIFRVDPDPSAVPNVHFTVAFSEPVTGVDVSDLTLATSGISGASINR